MAAIPAFDPSKPFEVVGGAPPPFDPSKPFDVVPSFGSDEYVNSLAKRHGADPRYIRDLVESRTSAEGLAGTPIAGAFVNQAGAGISALAQPLTGAGMSGGTLGERYRKNRDLENEIAADFEREHPYTTAAARVVGGLATTGAASGTTLGARALGMDFLLAARRREQAC